MHLTRSAAVGTLVAAVAVGLGRWAGYRWPIAVLIGISVYLIVSGLLAARRRSS